MKGNVVGNVGPLFIRIIFEVEHLETGGRTVCIEDKHVVVDVANQKATTGL